MGESNNQTNGIPPALLNLQQESTDDLALKLLAWINFIICLLGIVGKTFVCCFLSTNDRWSCMAVGKFGYGDVVYLD